MTNKKENDIVELTEDQIDNVSGGDLKMGDKTIVYCEYCNYSITLNAGVTYADHLREKHGII